MIIGVARDAKYVDLRESDVPFVYFAALQSNTEIHSLEVRTERPPLALAGALRDLVRQADPHLRIGEITTLEKRINQKLAREFLIADIASFFSGLTLLLVSIDIYGTLAYTVARRTNEIGIRMALGARAASVVGVVLHDLLRVLVPGLVAGVASAVAVQRLMCSMLFGLKPADLLTIGLAALVLTVATLTAAYIPARRASRVDPATALRFE